MWKVQENGGEQKHWNASGLALVVGVGRCVSATEVMGHGRLETACSSLFNLIFIIIRHHGAAAVPISFGPHWGKTGLYYSVSVQDWL